MRTNHVRHNLRMRNILWKTQFHIPFFFGIFIESSVFLRFPFQNFSKFHLTSKLFISVTRRFSINLHNVVWIPPKLFALTENFGLFFWKNCPIFLIFCNNHPIRPPLTTYKKFYLPKSAEIFHNGQNLAQSGHTEKCNTCIDFEVSRMQNQSSEYK